MAKEILIAESDKSVQKEFEKIFEITDYQIVFSGNEEETLLRIKLFRPDLIMGGRDLCQAVKDDPEFKQIPFILLLNPFEDLSEKERQFLQVEGMISRPLNGDDVLNSVDRVMEVGKKAVKEGTVSEEEKEWKTLAGIEKKSAKKEEAFTPEEIGETEEEIIELVEVFEEPEQRMSITDFAISQKEEAFEEVPPLEPWTKQEEQKPFEKEFALPPEEKGLAEEEVSLQLEEKAVGKEKAPEEGLFEKIELEEILQKVEKLQPSIEKEWPAKKMEEAPEKEKEVLEEAIPVAMEPKEKVLGIEEFETALKKEVEGIPAEEELPPLLIEEPQREAPGEVISEEAPVEKELEELSEEEFPEAFLEELEGELEKLEEKEAIPVEVPVEIEAEKLEEEEISMPFEEEAAPTSLFEEGPEEEVAPVEEFKKEEIREVEEILVQRVSPEEIPSPLFQVEKRIEEIISKGVGEMMQDFMIKVIPEITRNILTLTIDRIEKMVRETVPEIAEKAIQEEIKRLQKEEKE